MLYRLFILVSAFLFGMPLALFGLFLVDSGSASAMAVGTTAILSGVTLVLAAFGAALADESSDYWFDQRLMFNNKYSLSED